MLDKAIADMVSSLVKQELKQLVKKEMVEFLSDVIRNIKTVPKAEGLTEEVKAKRKSLSNEARERIIAGQRARREREGAMLAGMEPLENEVKNSFDEELPR